MSGSVLAPWAHQVNPRANARILANNLRCFDYDASSLLQCLQVVYSQCIYLMQTSINLYWWKFNYKSTIFIFQNKPMLDIVAEVNRMVQNGNTSALFSPVNEYDWVSSDQVNFDFIVFDIDWKFSLPLDDVFLLLCYYSFQRFIGKDPLTALKRGDFKKVSWCMSSNVITSKVSFKKLSG